MAMSNLMPSVVSRRPLPNLLSQLGIEIANPVEDAAKKLAVFKKTKESKALVSWINNQYTECNNARSRDVQQWNYNLAMFFGNQNISMYPNDAPLIGGKFYVPPPKKGVERLVINRVRPFVRTELARVLSQKPAASVVPASSEDADLMAAQAGEQVWESVNARKNFHVIYSKAAFWQIITGNGFIKTYWDDSAYDKDSKQQGDVVFSSIQPYNLFVPDLLQQELEDQPYVLEVSVKPVDLINHMYADVLDRPAIATATSASSLMQGSYTGKSDGGKGPDSVLVYSMWVKPGGSKLLPDGGYVCVVNDEIVHYSEGLPYNHGEYPYTKFEHIPTSKFYADSPIVDIISLNKEYNRIRSQVADNRRKMGNIQFNAHKGSIMPERMTNEVGQFNIIRPGMQYPQQVQPAELPQYIPLNLQWVLSDIEDITGQHQVSRGAFPSGVTAATAISYLQERDDALLTHTYQSIEQGVEKIARQTLELTVQYWDEERLVRVVGADGAFDSRMLRGADIASGTDIRTEAGSALPQSKAAKQAFIMDLMKFGYIDPNEGLKMMEIGGAQKIFEQLRVDERQAQRENIKLKTLTPDIVDMHQQDWAQASANQDPKTIDPITQQPLGTPPVVPVNSYDNHKVHIDVHNRYRRGQAYELLDDVIKAQFETHVEQHKLMIQNDTMQQFMDSIPVDNSQQTDQSAPDNSAASAPTGSDPGLPQQIA